MHYQGPGTNPAHTKSTMQRENPWIAHQMQDASFVTRHHIPYDRVDMSQVTRPNQVGVGIELTSSERFANFGELNWRRHPSGHYAAVIAYTVEQAVALRIALNLADFPEKLTVKFINADPNKPYPEAYLDYAKASEYLDRGVSVHWSPIHSGDTLYVELNYPDIAEAGFGAIRIELPGISYIFAGGPWVGEPGKTNAAKKSSIPKASVPIGCNVIDVSCGTPGLSDTPRNGLSHATGFLSYIDDDDGRSYNCTGHLINDRDSLTFKPYMLTAAHCINSETEAASVVVYWDYRSNSCGGDVNHLNSRVTRGATLRASRNAQDWSFIELDSAPPQGRFFLGWDSNSPGLGETLYHIGHSEQNPQSYARGRVSRLNRSVTVVDFGRTTRMMDVAWNQGLTGASASGSILVTADLRARSGGLSSSPLEGLFCNRGFFIRPEEYNFSITIAPFSEVYPHIRQYIDNPVVPDWTVDLVSVDPLDPLPESSISISATVDNVGNAVAGFTTLRYYLSGDSTIDTGDTQLCTDFVSSTPAGGRSNESETCRLPRSAAAGQNYWIGACVDADDNESDRSNNCSNGRRITIRHPIPNWSVELVSVDPLDPLPESLISISVTVRNVGNAAADSTTLRYYLSGDSTIDTGDTQLCTGVVSSTSAGGQSSESETCRLPRSAAAGQNYWIGACADAVSNESDTSNNCSNGRQITIRHPVPDWSVELVSVSPLDPLPESSISISATVDNVGNGAADSTTLRYYLSGDSTIDTGDTQLCTDSVSSTPAGGRSNESETCRLPRSAAAGQNYWIGACADAVSNESDTSNNCSNGRRITIRHPLPTMIVITVSDANATEGRNGNTATFRVSLNHPVPPIPAGLTAGLRFTTNGSTTLAGDYNLFAIGADLDTALRTLTFRAGDQDATVTLVPADDNVVEADETARLNFLALGGLGISDTNPVVITISDDDAPAVISLETIPSPVFAGRDVRVLLTLDKPLSESLTVTIAVAGSSIGMASPVSADDYTLDNNTIVIPAGQTMLNDAATIHTFSDATSFEAFIVRIVETSLPTLVEPDVGGRQSAVLISEDSNLVLENFSAVPSQVPETSGSGTFTAQLAGPPPAGDMVTAIFQLPKIWQGRSTAIPGTDYGDFRSVDSVETTDLHGTGEIVFSAGNATTSFSTSIMDDDIVEPREQIVVTITGLRRGTATLSVSGGHSTAVMRIEDDDGILARIRVFLEGALQ